MSNKKDKSKSETAEAVEPKPKAKMTEDDVKPKTTKENIVLRPFMAWTKPCSVDEGTAVGASIKNKIKPDKPVTEAGFREAVEKYLNARTY